MSMELDLPRGRPSDSNKARKAELRMKVWDLRVNGYTFRQIAETLGISQGYAHELESEELELRPGLLRDTMRAQMVERVEVMRRDAVAKYAATGDPNAFKAYQWAEERLARLLGLDEPVKTEAKVSTVETATPVASIVEEALAAEAVARAARNG